MAQKSASVRDGFPAELAKVGRHSPVLIIVEWDGKKVLSKVALQNCHACLIIAVHNWLWCGDNEIIEQDICARCAVCAGDQADVPGREGCILLAGDKLPVDIKRECRADAFGADVVGSSSLVDCARGLQTTGPK